MQRYVFSVCLQSEQVVPYHMEYDCIDPVSEKPKFIDTGDTFFQTVSVYIVGHSSTVRRTYKHITGYTDLVSFSIHKTFICNTVGNCVHICVATYSQQICVADSDGARNVTFG